MVSHSESSTQYSTTNGVVVYRSLRDPAGTIIDFTLMSLNQTAEKDTGRSSRELIGQSLSELFPVAINNGLFQTYRQVVETGEPAQFTLHHGMPGQSRRGWYEISAFKSDDGLVMSYVDVTDQRLAQQLLERQAAQYELALNSSANGVVVFQAVRDAGGNITNLDIVLGNDVSRSLAVEEEIQNQGLLKQFMNTESRHSLLSRLLKAVTINESFRYEYYSQRLDRWIDLTATPYGDYLTLTLTDITDNKRLSIKLQQQNALLEGILQSSLNGIALYEAMRLPDGTIEDFRLAHYNEAVVRIGGFDPEKLADATIKGLRVDSDGPDLFQIFEQVIRSGEPFRDVRHYPVPDLWIEFSIVRLNENQLVVSFDDISLSKKAELNMQQQRDLMNRVLNTSLIGIVCGEAIRNPEGAIRDFRPTLINQAVLDFTRLNAEQAYQLTSLAFDSALKQTGLFDKLVQVVDSGESLTTEYQTHGHWFNLYIARLNDGVVIMAADVTATRRYRLALEHSNQELKRSNENLQQFAYVASHDLQEPLRKIQSFGDILTDQFGHHLGEQGVDLLRRMQTASRRMAALIQDLLTYSRISSQREPFRKIDLQSVIADILIDHELTIRERRAVLDIDPLPAVTGDPVQIQQLFRNLISNALKFSNPQNPTHIRIYSHPVKGLLVPDVNPNDRHKSFVEISVQDNGIGFDEKYLDRIFQLFQRLHGKQKYGGTGIGLAICKKVVDNHGGYITAHSQPGAGATFKVYLPV